MTDETTKGAAGDGRPFAALGALLPELHDGAPSVKGRLVEAIANEIGPIAYTRPDLESAWETAAIDDCKNALVWLWRADRMGSSPVDGASVLDEAIASGVVARIVERLEIVTWATRPTPPCPSCGAPQALWILYGEPRGAWEEAGHRRELVIGGCLVGEDNPVWHCKACRKSFGRLGDEHPEMFKWKEESDG